MNRTPAIVGFLFVGAVILGLGFYFGNRERTSGDGVPDISIIVPATGDSVRNPLTLHFRTPAQLTLGMHGWMAGDLHIHAMVDSTEIMPAAADIRAVEGGYTWALPALPAGDHRVFLTWAGRNHGNLRGITDTLRLHILP